jgi:ATP-dependent DNA helicase RecG
VTGKLSDIGRQRIQTMVDSGDGFYIAEMDLKLRGPGEFFGTKQSGLPALRIANILRDSEILEIARREAATLLDRPETDDDRSRALEYLQGHWQTRYGLAQVG